MSQAASNPDKRGKKRKLKHVRPTLEQTPAVPSDAVQQHRSHKQQQQQEQDPDALNAGNSKFARALGSTDFHTREQGLQALSRWLMHRQLSELDMLKLWKGIYFCFWHSDKEPVQEDLAERLAGLILRMQPSVAVLYWAAMLHTLRAEWFALDKHRLNKFLMLARKFVAAVFARMAAANWALDTITSFTHDLPLIQDIVPVNQTRSLGLSYHLADVWLPELRKVAEGRAVPPAALRSLLAPFVEVLQHGGEPPLITRIRECVFEVLLQDLAAAAAEADDDDGDAASSDEDEDGHNCGYCLQLDVQQFAAELFDRGAQQGVKARNRQALYSISQAMERAAGKRRKVAADAPTSARGQKQQKQQEHQLRNSEQQNKHRGQQQSAAQLGEQASAVDRKRQQQQQQQQDGADHPLQVSSPDVSTKKGKQRQQKSPRQKDLGDRRGANGNLQQQGAQPAPTAALSEMAAAGAVDPVFKSPGKHASKRKQGSTGGGAAAAAGVSSPAASKRGVKINLKQNLYFEHGAPPFAAEVRTPPKAKPKGSALKSTVKLDSSGRPTDQVAAASKAARKLVSPKTVPRLRAAEFF